ncbi:peptidase M50B-like-domain-containing protein [Fimicolochytrium jonesii]|uniref:peptidase M50B-like-domain-containing protein n=1 Tax=Fimicolochytrium jonesii TaxID=1396493 RepID=UPI0022FDFC73|nr:peptidase M50B-like-domain-containing protein [Fimicolochytrium jonesii]KAI8820134.1 peptidase M50B-like-domain-containing protein [Fimicolochytrium jonesii]
MAPFIIHPRAPIGDDFASRLEPSPEQKRTIIFIAVYAAVITVLWNVPVLKQILWPFKIVTVALHEFSHALAALLTGGHIVSITLDPDEGGLTRYRGGSPYIALPAGYIGSAFWGALMIFAGFDVLASKIVSVMLAVAMLATLWWARNWLARGVTVLFIGLVALLWWLDSGYYLRYFVLFVGVMSCLYSLWDIIEDLVTRKVNQSDASQFAELCCGGHCLPAQAWGAVWFVISLAFLVGAVIAALLVFKEENTGV